MRQSDPEGCIGSSCYPNIAHFQSTFAKTCQPGQEDGQALQDALRGVSDVDVRCSTTSQPLRVVLQRRLWRRYILRSLCLSRLNA